MRTTKTIFIRIGLIAALAAPGFADPETAVGLKKYGTLGVQMKKSNKAVEQLGMGTLPIQNYEGPLMGISIKSLEAKEAEAHGLKGGVLVTDVHPGSAAEKAEVFSGDIVTGLGDQMSTKPVDSAESLKQTWQDLVQQQLKEVSLSLLRGQKSLTLKLRVPYDQPSFQTATLPSITYENSIRAFLKDADGRFALSLRSPDPMDRRAEELARQYKEATPEKRLQIKKDLSKLLSQLFDKKEAVRKEEITRLQKQLEDLQGSLGKRQAAREKIIERRLDQLLGEDELDWPGSFNSESSESNPLSAYQYLLKDLKDQDE